MTANEFCWFILGIAIGIVAVIFYAELYVRNFKRIIKAQADELETHRMHRDRCVFRKRAGRVAGDKDPYGTLNASTLEERQ